MPEVYHNIGLQRVGACCGDLETIIAKLRQLEAFDPTARRSRGTQRCGKEILSCLRVKGAFGSRMSDQCENPHPRRYRTETEVSVLVDCAQRRELMAVKRMDLGLEGLPRHPGLVA